MRHDDLDRHLVTGERRVIKVRRHPAALLHDLGRASAALLVVLTLLWFVPPEATVVSSLLWYVGVVVLGLFGYQVLQWWVERIVVTDRRVLLSSGILVTRVAMMPLRKVTDLTFEHTIAGRTLGYFTMIVESAGQSQGLSRIEFLPAPQRLRSAISELLFGDGRAAGTRTTSAGARFATPTTRTGRAGRAGLRWRRNVGRVRHTDRVLIDLHCHSTASDGTDTPAELVAAGSAAGLDVMAITDHDNTGGWGAAAAALPAGLSLVRGAEISCEVPTSDGSELTVHLLALLFDPGHPQLVAELERVRGDRGRRLRVMAERMAAAGLPIDVDEVIATAGVAAGRPHLGQALVRAGYVASMDEAFAGVLALDGGFYEDKQGITLSEAVPLVAAAGGVSVLAHCRASRRGAILTDGQIAELAAAGLDGLEVDHMDHTAADRAHLRGLGAELGLVPTGSSDYHGTNKTVRLPADTTAPEAYAQLVQRATGVPVLHG